MFLLKSSPASQARVRPRPSYVCAQCRHASLLRRPKRPYTFTQLVTLSDGSTYMHRTTSPAPIYRSTKDTRNSVLWNPSSQKLLSIEADEAGRLRAFRARFGRGWDARVGGEEDDDDDHDGATTGEGAEGEEGAGDGSAGDDDGGGSLMDLITGYGTEAGTEGKAAAAPAPAPAPAPGKKEEKGAKGQKVGRR